MNSLRTMLSKTHYGFCRRFTRGFTGEFYRGVIELQHLQWQDPQEVRRRQLQRIQLLLAHATRHVPYYRDLHAKGSMPDRIESLEEMSSIPVLRKQAIAADPDAFMAANMDRRTMLAKRSGGTSGWPLNFYVTREEALLEASFEAWGNALAGYRVGDPIALLWGSRFDAAPPCTIRQRIAKYLGNLDVLISNCMDDACMALMVEHLQRVRPTVLVGYVTSVVELARFLRNRRIVPDFPLRGVIAAAEPLTPAQRELLESVYHKPIFNRYGGRETGLIAMECERHEGLHINCENLWLDLEPSEETDARHILVTKLREYGMPFIRYDIGDYTLGCKKRCSCGRGFPIIESVRGRQVSTLRQRDGTATPGQIIINMLDYQPIRQYRIVQEEDYSIRLEIVPDSGYCDSVQEQIVKKLQAMVRGLPVKVDLLQQIQRTPSGKLPPMVSHVKYDKGVAQIEAAQTTGAAMADA